MTTDLYDALTLEVERADVLTEHLADRLSVLSGEDALGYSQELYALSLIAQGMCEKHALIVEKAEALWRRVKELEDQKKLLLDEMSEAEYAARKAARLATACGTRHGGRSS